MTSGDAQDQDAILSEALDWVIRIHSGASDPGMQAELDQWLMRSEHHAAAFHKAGLAWQLTGDLPRASAAALSGGSVSADGATQPSRYLPISIKKQRDRAVGPAAISRPRRRIIVGLSAGAAIALALAFGVLSRPHPSRGGADYMTGTAETRQIKLTDGSAVDLGARTAITVYFSSTRRRIALLDGEAFFRAVHSDSRPFIVAAGPVTVTTIGTAFDVALRARAIDVAVQQGAVRIALEAQTSKPVAALFAGYRLAVDRRTGGRSCEGVPPAQVGAWRSGRLVVQDIPISQVIDEIRSYYHGFIIEDDKVLAQHKVTGSYNLQDPVGALTAVVAPYGGVVTHITPFILIVSSS